MKTIYDRNGKPRDKRGRFIKGIHYSKKTEFTSENTKGENNPMYGVTSPFKGKKHKKSTKLKMSKSAIGKLATSGSFKKGHKVPLEWREKISKKTNKGKSPIHKLLYSRLYSIWTKPILERDNYKCQKCGSKINLEVHHDDITMAEIIDIFMDENKNKKEIYVKSKDIK